MTRRKNADFLTGVPGWPLLLDCASAVAFLSLDQSEFERAVAQGEMPPPVRFADPIRWSRLALEARFAPDGLVPDSFVDLIAAAIAAA